MRNFVTWERWETRDGIRRKIVVRDVAGKLHGATNYKRRGRKAIAVVRAVVRG